MKHEYHVYNCAECGKPFEVWGNSIPTDCPVCKKKHLDAKFHYVPVVACLLIGILGCALQGVIYLFVSDHISYSTLLAIQFFVLWVLQSCAHYNCLENLKGYIASYG